MALASSYTYNISSNGSADGWYWEVLSRGEIIGRGLAATEAMARADAMSAAVSHVDPRPKDLPSYLEDPIPPIAASRGRLGERFWPTERPQTIGTTACLRHCPPMLSCF
jgi:hypothetical protein